MAMKREAAVEILRDYVENDFNNVSTQEVSDAVDLLAGSDKNTPWFQKIAKGREFIERLDKESSAASKPDNTPDDSAFVKENAGRIFAALLSNPSLVQWDAMQGWRLCNCYPLSLAEYAWHCSRELERAQFTEQQGKQ
jgi:hypothetical protein